MILEMYRKIGNGNGLKELRLVEKRFAILIGSRIELWFVIRNEDAINCFRESDTNWKWVKLNNKDILQEFLREFVKREEEVNEIDSK